MILCVPAAGPDLSSPVDEKFGRCQYLHFIETDTLKGTYVENTQRTGRHGVGVQVAQRVVDEGAGAVICSRVGPNAMEVLKTGGVRVYEGGDCTVQEAVALYHENRLSQPE